MTDYISESRISGNYLANRRVQTARAADFNAGFQPLSGGSPEIDMAWSSEEFPIGIRRPDGSIDTENYQRRAAAIRNKAIGDAMSLITVAIARWVSLTVQAISCRLGSKAH